MAVAGARMDTASEATPTEFQRAAERSLHEIGPASSHPKPLASVALILASGGDRRIWPDPATGRNRYGTLTVPAADEISFSSSTASNVSMDGYHAAMHEWLRLVGDSDRVAFDIDRWFDDIRGAILHGLGCLGSEIILAASGTDAELITLCILSSLSERPLTNIFLAPDETGNGVPRAAGGFHFSDLTALGYPVVPETLIAGLMPGRIDVRSIALRTDSGAPRHADQIDDDLIATVRREIARDRDVVVHVLDTSKTGLTGVTRATARHVAALAPGRVRVVIDACQLRCPLTQLRQDLADGFLVTVTGSKFVGAPPFAGAVLLPSAIADELTAASALPIGLADYTAAQDWPDVLRGRIQFAFKSEMNLGLGLRWIAGLANLARISRTDSAHHEAVKAHFVRLVRERAGDMDGVVLHADDDGEHLVSRSIVPLTIVGSNGGFAAFEEAAAIQTSMRSADRNYPVCHVGQPVRIASRAALRVSASALDIAAASERISAGFPMEEACRPLESDLDVFFHTWATRQQRLQGC